MSQQLILCSGLKASKKFQRAGWQVDRQVGSHLMLVKDGFPYTLSIPLHKELGIGILKKLVNLSGLTNEEFNNL